MSEYVKIKRRVYDELIENQVEYKTVIAKYELLKKTLEAMLNVCNSNDIKNENTDCANLPV